MARVVRLPNVTPREKWVERISSAWREQLPSIFETGNLLEAAKAELAHGEWLVMVKEELPFNASTAQRLMKIANSDNLRNTAHAQYLPSSWMTLYELTKLTDEKFESGIKSGAIHPKMERKHVNDLRGRQIVERKPNNTSEKDPINLSGWRLDLHSRITRAAFALSTEARAELFVYLRQIMATTERDLASK